MTRSDSFLSFSWVFFFFLCRLIGEGVGSWLADWLVLFLCLFVCLLLFFDFFLKNGLSKSDSTCCRTVAQNKLLKGGDTVTAFLFVCCWWWVFF